MANRDYTSADLETVATTVLFGPRDLRLDVLNVFRGQNSEADIDYLVNAQQFTDEDIDNSFSNLETAAGTAAPTGDFVADSVDMEVVFTAALTYDRKFRLDLLNVFRTAQGLDDVDYLVNAKNPTYGAFTTALDSVENASLS